MWQTSSSRTRPGFRRPRAPRPGRAVRRPHRFRASLDSLEARALLTTTELFPLGSIPALHSDPGARASLYLDFDGHFEPVWGAYSNVTNPAYDVDGDPLTFNDHELANIEAIWEAVSEDYAPFNIDVTTVEPAALAPGMPIGAANGVALRVAIGGTPAELGMGSGVAGYSYINSFTSSIANVSYVFPENATTRDTPTSMAAFISHEAGHGFGLQHQSTYDAGGTKTLEYNWGDGTTWAPLMGTITSSNQATIWYNGTSSLGANVYQDDMAVISGPTNGFGYRADDHGNTIATAAPLAVSGGAWSGSGIIGTNTDVDMFSFTVTADDTYRIAVDNAPIGPNLDAVVELRGASGQVLATAAPTDSLDAAIVRDLAPGTYYVAVKGSGSYGWIGQYTVGVDIPPAAVVVTPASNLMSTGEDGRSTSFQVTLGTQPLSAVVVPIASSNTAEGTVSTSGLVFTPGNWNIPQTVTITGAADGVADGDVAYSVLVGAAASSDPEYSGLDPNDVAVINVDNDAAGFLYRTDHLDDAIGRMRLGGSQPEPLVDLEATFGNTLNFNPHGIAVDLAGGKVYWTEATTHSIQRANLDGSGAVTLVATAAGNPTSIALDTAAGKMYWSDAADHTIHRANLDGSVVQNLMTDASSNIWGVALDVAAGKMYWTDANQHRISRANLDGSNVEVLWTGTSGSSVVGIALDVAGGKMYWTDEAQDVIRRANLDGSNVEVLVNTLDYAAISNVNGITLDTSAGKVYWGDISGRTIYRMNLDGSMLVALNTDASTYGLAVVHPGPGIGVTHGTAHVTTEAGGTDAVRVSLNTKPAANVTIAVSSSDTTEGIVSTSTLTFTPANWNVTQVVAITGVDDTAVDGNITYTIILGAATSADPAYNGIDPADATVTNTDNDVPVTKFYVVNDGSPDRTYEYGPTGSAVENYALGGGDTAPRGAASTAAGTKVWVVDANKNVYVYNTGGGLLGSWLAGSLASNATVEGIATNGTDVWIVDARQDKVFRYAGAASRLSGSQNAAGSFSLNSGNTSPKDVVTDGTSLWVVNDSTTDKVFKYSLSGSLVGSWTITGAGSSPTGITLDPSNVSALWIADNGTDRVYQFAAAAGRTSGSQSPSMSFALAAGNTNPQGIADPPPGALGTRLVTGADRGSSGLVEAGGPGRQKPVSTSGTGVPASGASTRGASILVPWSPSAEEDVTLLATELIRSGTRRTRPFA